MSITVYNIIQLSGVNKIFDIIWKNIKWWKGYQSRSRTISPRSRTHFSGQRKTRLFSWLMGSEKLFYCPFLGGGR